MASRSVLVCVLPARGHVAPTAAVVEGLIADGDAVHVVTGDRYAEWFTALGADITLLDEQGDFDDSDFDASFPGRSALRGLALARHDLTEVFVRPMPSRWASLQRAIQVCNPDVVLVDPFFLAGIPLVLARSPRPRVLVLGLLPMTVPPLTAPGRAWRARELAAQAAMRVALRPAHQLAADLTRQLTGQDLPVWFTAWTGLADGILQLTCRGLEYPRPAPPCPIHFVGAPTSSTPRQIPYPPWWDDLDGGRPVIHVTQGTVANADPSQVILPTLQALADRDCLVVVTTGGTALPGRLPANVRIADLLPYDALLPRTHVMLSNGGYGGVNHALSYGVPLLVVGASEDKRAVAERVRWSGAGIGIPKRSISPRRITTAVDALTGKPGYRAAAQRLGAEFAAIDSRKAVRTAIDRTVQGRVR